jgi:WD40 repeat protein
MDGLLDFDVAIEQVGGGYRARVVASPAGQAHADFVLPFTDKDLKILVLEVAGSIGRARRKVRRIQTAERRLLEEFGGQLFQAVFSGSVHECLGRSRLVADNRGAGLRIRLLLPGALANVPWEYLYDEEYGFLGLSPETALVRSVELLATVPPFPVSPPLRVLAMISAPVDVPELQGDEEWDKLTGSLADLADRGMVRADRLEAGTLAALQRPLRLHEYHVLHFVGHGYYDDDAQDGALALEGPDRKTRLVTGRDLGMMIRGHRSLRLVVLNACEGARSASDDPLGGVAQALVRQGIPAVIAMQFEISDPAALVFSKSFYQAIADGLPVDVAMVEARKAMFAEGHEVEWATPVLYLRSPDGRVFTVGQVPDAEQRARELAERQAREEADRQAREQADRRAREQADRRARQQAQQRAREEAERQAREQADRRAREEAEQQAREQADQRAREEAEQQVWEEANRNPREYLGSLGYLTLAAMARRLGLTIPGTRWELTELLLAQPAERRYAAERDIRKPKDRQEEAEAEPPAPAGLHATPPASPPLAASAQVPPSHLARTLTGHDSEVWAVAFSPNGRLLATASKDGTARLWAPATGQHLRTLTGHASEVVAVAFSPDSRLLATASGDKTARVWDMAGGPAWRYIHDSEVVAVAFSPDGRLLATASQDGTARLWDPGTGECLHTLTGHAGRVVDVAFSPDGRLLATAGGDTTETWRHPAADDKTARIWDPGTGECLHTLTGHTSEVVAVAFSPDGRLLATASQNKTAHLWDPATGERLRKLKGHTSEVVAVAFSPDGRLLATASKDRKARLWDPATGERLRTLTGDDLRVDCVAFSPNGILLTVDDADGTLGVWDPATGGCLRTLTGHTSEVVAVAFSPDGRLLATASSDRTARLWDLPGRSPRAHGWAVAVDDLGLVLVPGGGGAVGVEDDGPAPLVDDDLVVKEAEQGAVGDASRAAVGLVAQVVHLAAGRGLVTAAGEPAVLVPQDHRAADRGRDVPGHSDVERQAGPAQPRAELPAAQEARQPAWPREQIHGFADDRLHQGVAGPGAGVPVELAELGAQPDQVLQRAQVDVPGDDGDGRGVAGEGHRVLAVQPGAPVAAALGGDGTRGRPLRADLGGPLLH